MVYVVTHHLVLFIYLTLSSPSALAETLRNWPRPHRLASTSTSKL